MLPHCKETKILLNYMKLKQTSYANILTVVSLNRSSHVGDIVDTETAVFLGHCSRCGGRNCNIASGNHIGYILVFFHIMLQVIVSCIVCNGRSLKNLVQDSAHSSAAVCAEVTGLFDLVS